MMFVTSSGRSLYYEIHGTETGCPVVFLHHGLGAVQSWKRQVHALSDAGWRVIVYDRWGYGQSDPRQELCLPYFEDDVEDLRQLLDHLAADKADLVGHSDGATTALYFAARYPERVGRLVVVAAHIYVEQKMEAGIRSVNQAFQSDPRFREGLRRLHGDKVDMIFNAWFGGWYNQRNLDWDMRPILRAVPHRALVVQGMEDEHATPQHARDLADTLPDAELWLAPSAAHMLPQEIPEEFNRRVLAFLEERR